MRGQLALLVLAAVAGAAGCGGPAGPGDGDALPLKEVRIAWAAGALPTEDPFDAAWEAAPKTVVPLLLQDVAEPRLTEKGAETLTLRALTDGERVSFRLSFADDAPDGDKEVDRSSDAAAIQLPATGEEGPLPDSMMGEEGRPVSIHLWRYSWQLRVEGESWGVRALYPNAAIDHYPPEGAKEGTAERSELDRLYEPPLAVGNPLAAHEFKSAVEDLTAERFGTLTTAETQRSTGRGVHRDGTWTVVITRPLDTAPGSPGTLRPGRSTYLAVAVWNGSLNHSGARKMRSVWVPVNFEEASQ